MEDKVANDINDIEPPLLDPKWGLGEDTDTGSRYLQYIIVNLP